MVEIMRQFCTECGNPLTEDSQFCGFCGTKIADGDAPQAKPAVSDGNAPNAPQPQQPYPAAPPPPAPYPVPVKKGGNKKLLFIILGAVLGALLLAVGLWFFFLRGAGPLAPSGNGDITQGIVEPQGNDNGAAPLTGPELQGLWDVTFRQYIEIKEEGAADYQHLGLIEVYLETDIADLGEGNLYLTMKPVSGNVNGEAFLEEELTGQEAYFEGSLANDTLSFYLETNSNLLYTAIPIAVDVPLAVATGKLSGTFETTLEELIEGHDMRYTVKFEFVQR